MSGRLPLVVVVVALAVVPSSALAYLDGGSSSLLFQAATAALFTLLFVVRSWWGRIRALFRRPDPAPPADPGPGETPPSQGR